MLIVHFCGGFANQLFQYAFYLKLKEMFPCQKVLADISHYKNCHDHGGFKLDRFIKLVYFKGNQKQLCCILVNELNFEKILDNISKNDSQNYFFQGYWQALKYFPKDFTVISDVFSESLLAARNIPVASLIKNCNSVSVHVRRGDYMNNFMHGNIANRTYFQNAISCVTEKFDDAVFFVFSDDLDWCRKNLDFHDSQVYFVDGNTHSVEQDIILMSLCNHNIVSNSSFSWWASCLNKNVKKFTIMPEYWFNQPTGNAEDLEIENALKIPNTPYVHEPRKNPIFSIIIPVYNTHATLRRTLASVLNQTLDDIEVIIVNDCSTDNSEIIINEYVNRDRRVKLFNHEKNLSSLCSRMTGVANATGSFILFLDSDDWLELDACERLWDAMKNKSIDMLEFGYINEPSRVKQPVLKDFGNRLDALLCNGYPVTLWNKVYKKSFIDRAFSSIKSFYSNYCEDGFLSVVLACNLKKFDYYDGYVHNYSVSTGISTQNNYSYEKFEDIVRDMACVQEHLIDYIKLNRPDYIDAVGCFMNRMYKNLAILAKRVEDKPLALKMLMKVDVVFGTDFFNAYVYDIHSRLAYYENIARLSFKEKIKFTVKYIVKKILKKIVKKY